MACRYLPAMHRLLVFNHTDVLFNKLIAIVWMHGGVAVSVKNDCRDRRSIPGNVPVSTRSASMDDFSLLAKKF